MFWCEFLTPNWPCHNQKKKPNFSQGRDFMWFFQVQNISIAAESKVVTQVCSKNANFRQHNSSSLAWQMCVLIITINLFKLQIHMQLVGMWVPRNYSDLWGNVPYLFVSTFCTFASLARFSHGLTVDSGNQNKILWSERVPCPSPHQAIQSITNSAASSQIKKKRTKK